MEKGNIQMSNHPETDRAFEGSHLETGFINEFCKRLETERNEAEALLIEFLDDEFDETAPPKSFLGRVKAVIDRARKRREGR